MPDDALLINPRETFSLTVTARYIGGDAPPVADESRVPQVEVRSKSDQPAKQRAEVMTLIRDLMDWCALNGIAIAVATDGKVTVRDAQL